MKWYALTDAPSDPLYVTIARFQPQPDGSVVLVVDPLSPDTGYSQGPYCSPYGFTDPAGQWCLANARERLRRVTLRPDAEVGIGDSTISIRDLGAYLPDYLASSGSYLTDPISYITLDREGYATMLVTMGPMVPADTYNSYDYSDAPGSGAEYVIVPDLGGSLQRNAKSALLGSGLFLFVKGVASGDPSIAAQVSGTCVIVRQDPAPGSQVERGATIGVWLDCPQTGWS